MPRNIPRPGVQRITLDKNRRQIVYAAGAVRLVRRWQPKRHWHTARKLALIRSFYAWRGYACVWDSDKLVVLEKEAE